MDIEKQLYRMIDHPEEILKPTIVYLIISLLLMPFLNEGGLMILGFLGGGFFTWCLIMSTNRILGLLVLIILIVLIAIFDSPLTTSFFQWFAGLCGGAFMANLLGLCRWK